MIIRDLILKYDVNFWAETDVLKLSVLVLNKKKTPAWYIFSFKGPTSAFSIFVGNLVPTKDYDELKAGLKEFFGKKNIEVLDVRIGASKWVHQ